MVTDAMLKNIEVSVSDQLVSKIASQKQDSADLLNFPLVKLGVREKTADPSQKHYAGRRAIARRQINQGTRKEK